MRSVEGKPNGIVPINNVVHNSDSHPWLSRAGSGFGDLLGGKHRTDKAVPGQRYDPTYGRGDALYMIGLSKIKNVGSIVGRLLLEHFESPRNVFYATKRELLNIRGIGPQTASDILKGKALFEAEKELAFADRRGIQILSIQDMEYPEMLKNIYDAPLLIYQKGNLELNNQIHIAIVGTRMPSTYGQVIAEQYAKFFVDQGCSVVSGLAYGIDGIVHRTSLEHKGKTVAVLGHGLNTIYPEEHRREAQSITESGALITEFGATTLPEARNFPMRNRIISGLCHATIVIEAGEKGGALITARSAFEQGRQVFAIPGDLTRAQSRGSNILIRDNIAKMVIHPSEVIEDLGLSLSPLKLKRLGAAKDTAQLSGVEAEVLKMIESDPQSSEYISKVLNIDLGQIKGMLIDFELKGFVRQEKGGEFRLVG